jgi:tetratricopeptide (TPR) repeat protein
VFDTLGKVCAARRWLRLALAAHRYALRLRGGVGDDIAVAKTLTNLGVTHRLAGDLPSSLACHETAMRIRSRYGDTVGMANSHNNLGLVLTDLGQWARASHHLRKALAIRTALGDAVNSRRNAQNLRRLALLVSRRLTTRRTIA